MSEYGFLTVTLLPLLDCKKREHFILHTSNVTSVGRNFFGEIEDGDDSIEDEETYPRTDDMYYDDEDTIEINEEGFVVGYNDIDSDGNKRTSETTNKN